MLGFFYCCIMYFYMRLGGLFEFFIVSEGFLYGAVFSEFWILERLILMICIKEGGWDWLFYYMYVYFVVLE